MFFFFNFSGDSPTTTQSNIEKVKEDVEDSINHIALKTGLKPVHVIVFVVCKSYLYLPFKYSALKLGFYCCTYAKKYEYIVYSTYNIFVQMLFWRQSALTCKELKGCT